MVIFEPENGSYSIRDEVVAPGAADRKVWLANCEAVSVIGMLWLQLAAS
jgi:hypothetical protein